MSSPASAVMTRDWSALLAGRARGAGGDGLLEILKLANATDVISFAGGFPDPSAFPGTTLADILHRLLDAGDATALQYSPTPGLESVRDYLATRLSELEGRRPADGELMVTSGAVEALDLVCKRFVEAGDVVVVEGPTYLGAIMAFRGYQAEIVAVEVDDDGLDTERLEALLREGLRPKLLYTIPDHQNPAGVSLSPPRRRRLLDLAERYGFLIVEDVAYRELQLEGEPAASLWATAPAAVVQAGTFSKLFFPGVRLGWAAGPAPVVAQMTLAKQNTDQCAGALGQRLLEEYGRSGELARTIAASRVLYRSRRDALLAALERHLPAGVRWSRPRGGFFLWLQLAGDADTTALAARAREHGVAFVPGEPFFPDGRGHTDIRLAYSRVGEDAIDEGVSRLAALLGG